MDKVLAVIIGATTVLLLGILVMAVFNTNIGGLESDLESTSSQGCEFQLENAEPGDDISDECQPEGGTNKLFLRNDESVIDAVTSDQEADSSE
jgi:hypothetical protein